MTLFYRHNENRPFLFQGASKEDDSQCKEDMSNNSSHNNNPNQNLETVHASLDEDVLRRVGTVFASMAVDDDKENEKKNQKSSATKKWYEGIVIKPVVFRSTTKRNFHEN